MTYVAKLGIIKGTRYHEPTMFEEEAVREFYDWERNFTRVRMRLQTVERRLEDAVVKNNASEQPRWTCIALRQIKWYHSLLKTYTLWRTAYGFLADENTLQNTRQECENTIENIDCIVESLTIGLRYRDKKA